MSNTENTIMLKRNSISLKDLEICDFCNQIGHSETNCLLFESEMEKEQDEKKQRLIKRWKLSRILLLSGIPSKYWNSEDPVKFFLMNNRIIGYRETQKWNNKINYITPKML